MSSMDFLVHEQRLRVKYLHDGIPQYGIAAGATPVAVMISIVSVVLVDCSKVLPLPLPLSLSCIRAEYIRWRVVQKRPEHE